MGKTGTLTDYFATKDTGVTTEKELATKGSDKGYAVIEDLDGKAHGMLEEKGATDEPGCNGQVSNMQTGKAGTLERYFARMGIRMSTEKDVAIERPSCLLQSARKPPGKAGTLTAYFFREDGCIPRQKQLGRRREGGNISTEEEVEESDDSDTSTEEDEDSDTSTVEDQEEYYDSNTLDEEDGSDASNDKGDSNASDEQERDEQKRDDSGMSSEEVEQEWEMEKILGHGLVDKIPKLLVKWEGYPENEATWEVLLLKVPDTVRPARSGSSASSASVARCGKEVGAIWCSMFLVCP